MYKRLNKLQMFAFRGKCVKEYSTFIFKDNRNLNYLEEVADRIIDELTLLYKTGYTVYEIAEELKYKLKNH